MKIIQSENTKIIRLDISPSFHEYNESDLEQDFDLFCQQGFSPSIQKRIMDIRCKINVIDKKSKEEVFGFLAEKRFSFDLETVDEDILTLYDVLEGFFLNISMYIQDNSSTSVKEKPDLMDLSKRTILDFQSRGYYP